MQMYETGGMCGHINDCAHLRNATFPSLAPMQHQRWRCYPPGAVLSPQIHKSMAEQLVCEQRRLEFRFVSYSRNGLMCFLTVRVKVLPGLWTRKKTMATFCEERTLLLSEPESQ